MSKKETTNIILVANNHNSGANIIAALKTKYFSGVIITDYYSTDSSIRDIIEVCHDLNITHSIHAIAKGLLGIKEKIEFQCKEAMKITDNKQWIINKTYLFFFDRKSVLQWNNFSVSLLTEEYYCTTNIFNIKDDNVSHNIERKNLNIKLIRLDCATNKDHIDTLSNLNNAINLYHTKEFRLAKLSSGCRLVHTKFKKSLLRHYNQYISILFPDIEGKILINEELHLQLESLSKKINEMNTSSTGYATTNIVILSLFYNLHLLFHNLDINIVAKIINIISSTSNTVIKNDLLWYWHIVLQEYYINNKDTIDNFETKALEAIEQCNKYCVRLEQYHNVISYYTSTKQYAKIIPLYLQSKDIIPQREHLFYDIGLKNVYDYDTTLYGWYIRNEVQFSPNMDNKYYLLKLSVDLLNKNVNYQTVFNNMHFYCEPLSERGGINHIYSPPHLSDLYHNTSCCIIPLNKSIINQLNTYFQNNKLPLLDLQAILNDKPLKEILNPKELPQGPMTQPQGPMYQPQGPISQPQGPIPEDIQFHSTPKYLINFRYVNYYIDSQGKYKAASPDGIINTENMFALLDSSLKHVVSSYYKWDGKIDIKTYPTRIRGLEDVRLIMYNENLMFTATSIQEYHPKVRVVYGKLNLSKMKVDRGFPLEPHIDTDCEKNWLPIVHKGVMNFIYGYYPMTIGYVNAERQLTINKTVKTPELWKLMCGSCAPVEHPNNKNELWMATHLVQYSEPRRYYHCIIILNKETLEPVAYTVPMCFAWNGVEYALSINFTNESHPDEQGKIICDTIIHISYSKSDKESRLISIPTSKLDFITM